MRCDAKIVLMSVDLPKPVWPENRNPLASVTFAYITVHPLNATPNPSPPRKKASTRQNASKCTEEGLTNDDDVELEAALEQLVLNLLSDRVEADIRVRTYLLNFNGSHCEKDGGTVGREKVGEEKTVSKGKVAAGTSKGRDWTPNKFEQQWRQLANF